MGRAISQVSQKGSSTPTYGLQVNYEHMMPVMRFAAVYGVLPPPKASHLGVVSDRGASLERGAPDAMTTPSHEHHVVYIV